MDILETRYNEGNATFTDFNDANLALVQAELSYQKQIIETALKITEIDYYSGQPINEWRLDQ
jgi:hypothetical protein